MPMVQGNVSVDDDGNETFTPNDATNCAMAVYEQLILVNSTAKMVQKVSGGSATVNPDGTITPPPPPTTQVVVHNITLDATARQKLAELAVAIAILVPYIQANAAAVIPATSAGNGLMNDSTNMPCKHPATQQTLAIT